MKNLLTAASLCSVMVLAAAARAQSVDVTGNTAGTTALTQRGATLDGKNSTAGAATASPGLRAEMAPAQDNTHIVPKPTAKGGAGNTAQLNGNQSADAPGANLKNLSGPDAQVARSADADAHRAVYDPNNQRGGAQGHTPTVPGVNADSDASTDASADANADTSANANASAATATPQ